VQQATDLMTDPELRAALAVVTPQLLIEAIDELMIVQHGREIGLKFNDEIFTRALDDLKKGNNIPDDAAFQAALKQEGLTLADLRVTIERAWLKQTVEQREIMRNMTLTEEEARKYFAAHQSEFMKPASVMLREIFVAVAPSTVAGQTTINVAADDAAREKISAIRERALKGEDFAKLVEEASESGTKANGGLIGPVLTADLAPALGDVIDKLKPGEIAEPIRTKTGYQLIKLESRADAEAEAFETSRDRIHQRILESRLDAERTKFLAKLRVQAVIEWKDPAYKKLYEDAVAAQAKAKGKAPVAAPGR
jgi:peptidyl-prolyl cis-trans isomerase SurA